MSEGEGERKREEEEEEERRVGRKTDKAVGKFHRSRLRPHWCLKGQALHHNPRVYRIRNEEKDN